MKKIIFSAQERALSVLVCLSLFMALFLFAGMGQATAQSTGTSGTMAPYGKYTFLPASVAVEALQNQLPILYNQLAAMVEGTKLHKRKHLEILCYKGIINDITGGKMVDLAYENNLADLTLNINLEDPGDLSYLRNVQSALFDLLTN